MSDLPSLRRSVPVDVETLEPAEFDMALHGLDDTFLMLVVRGLAAIPMSPGDVVETPFRIRAFEGFDVVFLVSRARDRVVVTITRVWPTPDRSRLQWVLKKADFFATIRGALGV